MSSFSHWRRDADELGYLPRLRGFDKIARSAKLTPFTAFADNRPVPDDFDGDLDELTELMGERTEWFDPAEGQAAMRALAGHIKASPKAAMRLDEPAEVIAELGKMARVAAPLWNQHLVRRA